jgi:hypothetical protein
VPVCSVPRAARPRQPGAILPNALLSMLPRVEWHATRYPRTSMPEYGAVLPNIRLRYGTMLPNSTSLGSAVWRQGEGPGECVCRQMHYEWAL